MSGDWIKVHRQLMDSAVWSDEWLVKLWIWCLLKANYRDGIYRGEVVKRGQFVTGRITGADELSVSPSKWYRGMMRLSQLGNIKIEANSVWTRITVCNYTSYQDTTGNERTANEQRMNSERTASGQRADTIEEGKKGRREEEQEEKTSRVAERHDSRGSSNGRHRKPAPYSTEFEEFWRAYPPYRRTSKGTAWAAWQKAIRLVDARTLIATATAYAASPRGSGEYSKMPATWLNGRCWEDDPASWGHAPASSQPDSPF